MKLNIGIRAFVGPSLQHPRALVVGTGMAVSGVAALSLLAFAGTGGDRAVAFDTTSAFEATIKSAQTARQNGPVAMSVEQCTRARGMLESSRETGRAGAANQPRVLDAMEAEFTSSLAWVDAGCPPDPILGFYPFADGKGGEFRLLRQQEFGEQGVGSANELRDDR